MLNKTINEYIWTIVRTAIQTGLKGFYKVLGSTLSAEGMLANATIENQIDSKIVSFFSPFFEEFLFPLHNPLHRSCFSSFLDLFPSNFVLNPDHDTRPFVLIFYEFLSTVCPGRQNKSFRFWVISGQMRFLCS